MTHNPPVNVSPDPVSAGVAAGLLAAFEEEGLGVGAFEEDLGGDAFEVDGVTSGDGAALTGAFVGVGVDLGVATEEESSSSSSSSQSSSSSSAAGVGDALVLTAEPGLHSAGRLAWRVSVAYRRVRLDSVMSKTEARYVPTRGGSTCQRRQYPACLCSQWQHSEHGIHRISGAKKSA